MERVPKLDPIPPRCLRGRGHFRLLFLALTALAASFLVFWTYQFVTGDLTALWTNFSFELYLSGIYLVFYTASYFFWARSRYHYTVQVFTDHLLIQQGKKSCKVNFADIESISIVCWSLFYLKIKSGHKYYFNSSLERVDYIWQGLETARPDLLSKEEYASFLLKLIKYDHHQKRKEWFFRHKMLDIILWIFVPCLFMALAYLYQSQQVVIYYKGTYFFRLFMYALLVALVTSIMFSKAIKKFVFDRKIEEKLQLGLTDRVRDLEFEGIVVQRSKLAQLAMTACLLTLVAKANLNFYSLTKVRGDIANFNMKGGRTLVVDNRYNCMKCPYSINDGDVVMFGKGVIGQVMAKAGDMVGEVSNINTGRMIASERTVQNIQEVPEGHFAVRAPNSEEIVFVKMNEIIGKVHK